MSIELKKLPIAEIELDTTNPRIQLALEMYGSDITAVQIALALKEDESDGAHTSFDKLKNSIIKCKGIINPIVVNYAGGKYVCIEGNTRLQIYHDLLSDHPTEPWSEILCYVHDDASQNKIDAIRLQAHLIGPRQWDPYSKARYIVKLWREKLLSYEEIIEYCGGKRKEIEQQIAAYDLAENVYREVVQKSGKKFDPSRFSGFVEYQNPKVYKAVQNDFTDEDFCKWLHDRKISRLEDVRRLPEILANDDAKKVFLRKNSTEAIKILSRPSLEVLIENLSLKELLEAVCTKISGFDYEDIEKIKKDPNSLPDRLNDASKRISRLQEDINDS